MTIMAGAALACAWIGLPHPVFPLLAAGIALAWAWQLAQSMQWRRSALCLLEFDAQGSVRCQDGFGRWQEAQILPGTYASGWLILLVLGAEGRRQRTLALLPDSALPDELRRLRVWLRWRQPQR